MTPDFKEAPCTSPTLPPVESKGLWFQRARKKNVPSTVAHASLTELVRPQWVFAWQLHDQLSRAAVPQAKKVGTGQCLGRSPGPVPPSRSFCLYFSLFPSGSQKSGPAKPNRIRRLFHRIHHPLNGLLWPVCYLHHVRYTLHSQTHQPGRPGGSGQRPDPALISH